MHWSHDRTMNCSMTRDYGRDTDNLGCLSLGAWHWNHHRRNSWSSYDFPGRHGLGWDRNIWPGIAWLINARVVSWWHVRGDGTLVGTPGLAEMLGFDTGTTKVTAAPTIGCCTTGTTWAGVAGPRAILTGLSWLDTWLPGVCPGVLSLVRWTSLTGLTTAICRTLDSIVFISTKTLAALDNTAVSLLLCPPAVSPPWALDTAVTTACVKPQLCSRLGRT